MGHDHSWLFRQGDLILGPVPSNQIVERLYSGELSGASEVQALGSGIFRKIENVPELKVHLAKAQAKHRVDRDEGVHKRSQKKRLLQVLAVSGGVLVLTLASVAVLGRYLAVHTPTSKSAEELAWGDISIDAPTITKARRSADDEMVEYAMNKRPAGTTTVAQRPVPANPANPANPIGKPKMGTADPDGLAMGEVDQGAINSVIGKFKPTLIPCLQQVAKPGMTAKIPIEFSIAETGKVSKVWVDNPDFKEGPLPECLLRELQKWPFRAAPSGATVQLSFNIGKRG